VGTYARQQPFPDRERSGENAAIRLHFAYYDLPRWVHWWKPGALGVHLRYLLWQLGAYRIGRDLCREVPFDIAHHITSGVFRHPSLLAFLDVPFVFGPVGRGETAPRELRGTFPVRGYVSDLVRDAITWVPWLEQAVVMRTYPRHDAFLFPSLHDSSGNAVLEALSQGLPVVCLDAGGPAVLVDSSCGIQVRPGEPDALVQDLADALCELAEDPVRLRSMGEAAVRRARDNFSWERQAARMAGLYRSLCAARHPRNGAVTEVTA